MKILTFCYDSGDDVVKILENGEMVWWERSFDSVAQYLRYHPYDEPVMIKWVDECCDAD